MAEQLGDIGLAGGAGAFLADGAPEMSGRLPVNPSGGLLSKGEFSLARALRRSFAAARLS